MLINQHATSGELFPFSILRNNNDGHAYKLFHWKRHKLEHDMSISGAHQNLFLVKPQLRSPAVAREHICFI